MPDPAVRALTAADWQAFRDIRLLALRGEPGVFSANLDDEAGQQPEWWQARVGSEGHQIFGAFDGDALVGTLGAFTWNEDVDGTTAILGMLFVHPGHRGRRMTEALFAACLAWVRARPKFRRVVTGHRAGNEPSMRAILRQGFRQVRRAPRLWPDGTTEDEVGYLLLTDQAGGLAESGPGSMSGT